MALVWAAEYYNHDRRFAINKLQQELEAYFNASFYSDEVRERYDPNYDVRPSTDVLVITSELP